MSGALAALGYGLAWHGGRVAPATVARAACRLGADLAACQGGPGTRQLRLNLARVVPAASPAELDWLARRGLRSYARYWAETFGLPGMDWAAVRARCAITGLEHFAAARERGRGIVVALTHSGNWDVAGVWLRQHYGRFSTVAERLRPESLYRRFASYRASLGFEILPADGGRATVRALLSRLRGGGVVALLADRSLSAAATPVSLFGESARLPAGPAWLAARTGAALVPVGSSFTAGGWAFRVHEAFPVAGLAETRVATQALADRFAEDIACHPTDWHMLQPVFASDIAAGGGSLR
jgi:KDO2-lipid IV(A) lauroyltransferase